MTHCQGGGCQFRPPCVAALVSEFKGCLQASPELVRLSSCPVFAHEALAKAGRAGREEGAALTFGSEHPESWGGAGPQPDTGPLSDCPGPTAPPRPLRVCGPSPRPLLARTVCLATEEARFCEAAVRLGWGLQSECRKRLLGLQHPPSSHAPTGCTSAPGPLSSAARSSEPHLLTITQAETTS